MPERLTGKILVVLQIAGYSLWLRCLNFGSRSPLTGSERCDVSLTSYGRRTRHVWKTLETIGRGEVRPRRVVLWLDEESVTAELPRTLQRLTRRGLEVRACADYGPHKKYFPYIMECPLDGPLVTADDDVLYPRQWLKGLVSAHREDEVTAYRCRTISSMPYSSWALCTSTASSLDLLPTGVSGVIYPPKVLNALRERGDEFMRYCPRADDFWLHYAAVASGVETRQVSETAAEWWPSRPRQKGLWHENFANGGNDAISAEVARAWLVE